MIVCSTGAGSARPGRFNDEAVELPDAAVVEPAQQIFQRVHQIAAHSAAKTARGHHDHVAVDLLDEQMIEPDLAEFVDQDDGSRQRGILQRTIEQGRLAGPEEAGDDCHGYRRGRGDDGLVAQFCPVLPLVDADLLTALAGASARRFLMASELSKPWRSFSRRPLRGLGLWAFAPWAFAFMRLRFMDLGFGLCLVLGLAGAMHGKGLGIGPDRLRRRGCSGGGA